MKRKEKKVFRTWDQMCLEKLKEIGKVSMMEWATAMDFKNPSSISRIARNLEEQGKVRIIHNKSGMIKKYYEAL